MAFGKYVNLLIKLLNEVFSERLFFNTRDKEND